MKSKTLALFLAASVFVSGNALAVPVDTTAAVDQISVDGTTAVAAVGAAIIALSALSMVYRWVMGAASGR